VGDGGGDDDEGEGESEDDVGEAVDARGGFSAQAEAFIGFWFVGRLHGCGKCSAIAR